jgi:plasminogen activator
MKRGKSIMRNALSIAVAFYCFLIAIPCADAQNIEKNKTETTKISEKVSFDIYGGYLTGQSREIVYNSADGRKISELFWKIDRAFVAGGTFAARPVEWLTIRAGGWTPVKSRNTMDDYDWEVASHDDWSDWSHHSDTDLNRGYMIDVSVAARVMKFEKRSWFNSAQVDLLVGYRWLYLNWIARGGTYIYSSKPGYRDVVGTFPDGEDGIGYEQWIETPYVGLGGSINISRWTLGAELTGSLWGRAHDRDNHYSRTIIFEDNFRDVPMVAGELKASYSLTDHLSLFGSFMYQRYFEAKGPSSASEYTTGRVAFSSGDGAGMDHYSMLFSLSVRWTF